MKSRRLFNIRPFLILLFLCSLTLCFGLSHLSLTKASIRWETLATAQSLDANQLVQKGIEYYQSGDYQNAIEPWQTALTRYQETNKKANAAIVLENLARVYQHLNQSEQALTYWERAIAYYHQIKDNQQVARLLVEQAQTYTSLGQPRAAIALLCSPFPEDCSRDSALAIARTTQDTQTEAAALGSLGEAYRKRGDYKSAIDYLQASLRITEKINNPAYQTSTLNNLGNTYISLANVHYRRANSATVRGDSIAAEKLKKEALNYDTQALNTFQQSLELARTQNDPLGQMRSLLNSITPEYRTQSTSPSLKPALSLLETLPDSRDKVYAAIDLAHLLQRPPLLNEIYSKAQCFKSEFQSQATALLQQGLTIAQQIHDNRAKSFALGELGHRYECNQNYQQALNLTQQARLAADQDLLAKDSLYLWEWQAGRIFKALRQEDNAIKAYERAIATLESIRGDILIANRDVQFDFRDTVDPIYREFVELKLELASLSSTPTEEKKKTLNTVLNTVDSLKLAELQDYFGSDCVLTALNSERVDLVGENTATAVFSSIILPDRTAIILSLPKGEKRLTWINKDRESLREEINNFRRGLESFFTQYNPQPAQKIYDWIIRPFAADLDQAQIKTLVFVQDGILRSVPMTALHDGEKFLVQKYAIATTPTLTLTDPTTLNREKLRALALGLTKPATIDGHSFPALPNVSVELSEVKTLIPGSKELLNDDFTRSRLQQELNQTVYPIIHIATHGEFGGDPENTFIVTGNNEKLTITELDAMLRRVSRRPEPVELLTLTACQTAAGDDRAALGLAGVAVQAGARSALASLWFINDAATAKIATNFYTNLRDFNVNKAEALRTAQVSLIKAGGKTAHPAYWAAFIMIGNWL
jgi:CHAT domain-containing protein/exonuclease VII small subunit